MYTSRDRSVVRLSVIPSAKYCWSGSLLRLMNGNTTIDILGATKCCTTDVAVRTPDVGDCSLPSQSHHMPTRSISTAEAAAASPTRVVRRRCGTTLGILDVGSTGSLSALSRALLFIDEAPEGVSAGGRVTAATKR